MNYKQALSLKRGDKVAVMSLEYPGETLGIFTVLRFNTTSYLVHAIGGGTWPYVDLELFERAHK